MICLDTDFIVDLLKQKENALSKFESLRNEVVISTELNYFEILYGIFINEHFSEREFNLIEEFFDSIPVLPLDHASSYNAAKISATLAKKGLTIGFNDELIGGICSSKNCAILTRNIKHFSRIKGLKVETY